MTAEIRRRGGTARSSSLIFLVLVTVATVIVTLLLIRVSPTEPVPGADPYLSPRWAIAIHWGTILPAIILGAVVLWRKKGGWAHRLLGAVWMALMLTTAIVSFWIRGPGGGLSGIHVFSVGVLLAIPTAIWRIRMRDVRRHRQIMLSLYIGLMVAGAFALAPGRSLGAMLFG
jgi:uncharacterized membrane protein